MLDPADVLAPALQPALPPDRRPARLRGSRLRRLPRARDRDHDRLLLRHLARDGDARRTSTAACSSASSPRRRAAARSSSRTSSATRSSPAIQGLIVLLVALALGATNGGPVGWIVIMLAGAFVAAGFAGISTGIALLTRKEATMIAVANFIGLPLLFFSSILIARALIPGWMRDLSLANPVEWAVRAAREPVLPDTEPGATSASSSPVLLAVRGRHRRVRDLGLQGIPAQPVGSGAPRDQKELGMDTESTHAEGRRDPGLGPRRRDTHRATPTATTRTATPRTAPTATAPTPTPTRTTLASLTAGRSAGRSSPSSAEQFRAEHWERRPLAVPRDEAGRFDDLLSVAGRRAARHRDGDPRRRPSASSRPARRSSGYTTDISWRPEPFSGTARGRPRRSTSSTAARRSSCRHCTTPGCRSPASAATSRRRSATPRRRTRTTRRATRRACRSTTTRTRCSRSRSRARSAGSSTSRVLELPLKHQRYRPRSWATRASRCSTSSRGRATRSTCRAAGCTRR